VIEDFQHVCITCRDLEASTRFYQLLGLEVGEPARELDEEHLAVAMNLPKGHINVLHLAPRNSTSGMFIDLVQWLEPASHGKTYPALNNVGINRVAFRVSELDKTVAALRQRGIQFLSEKAQAFGPIRTIVTQDPDGVFVQLLEWLVATD